MVIIEGDADECVEATADLALKVQDVVAVIKEEVRAVGEDDLQALVLNEIDRHRPRE
jgi:nicotinamidase-related amidase